MEKKLLNFFPELGRVCSDGHLHLHSVLVGEREGVVVGGGRGRGRRGVRRGGGEVEGGRPGSIVGGREDDLNECGGRREKGGERKEEGGGVRRKNAMLL